MHFVFYSKNSPPDPPIPTKKCANANKTHVYSPILSSRMAESNSKNERKREDREDRSERE